MAKAMPKLPPHQWIVSPVTYSGKQATESIEKKIDMKHPNETYHGRCHVLDYVITHVQKLGGKSLKE